METQPQIETGLDGKVIDKDNMNYIQYLVDGQKKEIQVDQIQQATETKKRKGWVLGVGLVLMLFTRPVFEVLFPSSFGGGYRTVQDIPNSVLIMTAVMSILIIAGMYTTIRYIIGDKYIEITHKDGKVALPSNKKLRQELFAAIGK